MEPKQVSLKKDSLSLWHVIGQGLIANGPLSAAAVALTVAASYALGATPLAYLFGISLVLLWVNTPYQFGKFFASASGVHYYAHKSMGPAAGYLAGISYAVYYNALLPANALFLGVLLDTLLSQFGYSMPYYFWIPIFLIFLMPPIIMNYLGIKPSLNYGIITAFVEIIALVAISALIILAAGPANTTAVFNFKLAQGGLSGFAVGMLVAGFDMSGTTATVYLGAEAKAPHETIRKGLLISTLMIVFLYILVSYAMTIGWGYRDMSTFANSGAPLFVELYKYTGVIPELLIAALTINSLVGLVTASTIVSSRLYLTFGKQGLFPKAFGNINEKHGTPGIAILFTALAGIFVGLILGFEWGIVDAYIFFILLATIAEFVGHIIGNVALSIFSLRNHMKRFITYVVIPIASLATVLFGIFYTFYPVTYPTVFAPLSMVVLLVGGFVEYYVLVKRNPNRLEKINSGVEELSSEVAPGLKRVNS
ncbi:MAG: APC family permease [Thermoprotei archaeon]